MLKTCYGLCSLRTGVKIVAFYELICTILFFLSVFVYEMFNKIYQFYDDIDVYYFLQSCIIIITLLKLLANVSLMQSTFQNAPSKIFFWIVITCIVYLTAFIVSIKMYIHKVHRNMFFVKSTDFGNLECHLLLVFILINFLSIVEIHVVTSYYKEEKHLKEIEQCTKTYIIMSSLKTHRDIENNMFIDDFSNLPITRSAAEVEASIFTSFKGVPV
ncbi:uncharacterized protein LOC112596001 [Melanaphis sacchari]|uniref:uncharacterized protein LOC112596001 n=1 Tax=Melanaphis sacchari TaxID=742174 RepID=UPI000DC14985|nr:uncharacterized protein LOC112596001 [Melanaphis sacchari]